MEKLPHQEYRDELADKLKDIRNSDPENSEIARAKAEGYLEAKKETDEYTNAQIEKDEFLEINRLKNRFDSPYNTKKEYIFTTIKENIKKSVEDEDILLKIESALEATSNLFSKGIILQYSPSGSLINRLGILELKIDPQHIYDYSSQINEEGGEKFSELLERKNFLEDEVSKVNEFLELINLFSDASLKEKILFDVFGNILGDGSHMEGDGRAETFNTLNMQSLIKDAQGYHKIWKKYGRESDGYKEKNLLDLYNYFDRERKVRFNNFKKEYKKNK